MYLVDFVYDGYKLSDYGCMVGSVVTENSDSISMGSVIRLETVMNHGAYRSEIVNADYPDVYTVTFDVFKTPCDDQADYFTDQEVSWFMRWLNRKEYKKFEPIYDTDDFENVFLMGTFTECRAINLQGQVYGFTLTFTTNSPFAYIDYNSNVYDLVNDGVTFDIINPYNKQSETLTGGTFTILDESDELGSIYPSKFIIEVSQAGRLVIWNERDERTRYTEVKNCVVNEMITFDCIHKVITSSNLHDGLSNDFNYVFPRLKNDMDSNYNIFHVTLDGSVEIEYKPVRKVGVIV